MQTDPSLFIRQITDEEASLRNTAVLVNARGNRFYPISCPKSDLDQAQMKIAESLSTVTNKLESLNVEFRALSSSAATPSKEKVQNPYFPGSEQVSEATADTQSQPIGEV